MPLPPFDEVVKTANEYLSAPNVGVHGYYALDKGGNSLSYANYGCYVLINSQLKSNRVGFAAFSYRSKLQNKIHEDYFNWVTSKEVSPWRNILKGEFVRLYNPVFHGYVLPQEMLEDQTKYSLQNFIIALRMQGEKPSQIHFWHHAVTKGVEPCLALYLSSFFILDDGGKIRKQVMSLNNHWPFGDRSIVKNLRDGLINEGSRIKGVWHSGLNDYFTAGDPFLGRDTQLGNIEKVPFIDMSGEKTTRETLVFDLAKIVEEAKRINNVS